jgi:hypothetical protein
LKLGQSTTGFCLVNWILGCVHGLALRDGPTCPRSAGKSVSDGRRVIMGCSQV